MGCSLKSGVIPPSPPQRPPRPVDGVTLIELIIVIAIIGIIALFATIDTAWFQRDARVTEARDRLLADIEDVKLKSLAQVPHAIFVTDGNAASYTVRRLVDADNDFVRDAAEATTTLSTVTLQTGMRIQLTGLTSGNELWFDRKGIPRTDTWAATVNATFRVWYDADGDGVYDSGDEQTKTISVSQDGRIQYE